jgi:hypothetical protein
MTRMHLMSLDCSPACVCAWSQEGSQALMFLANYAKKKGDFAEAEQYCMPFQPFLRTAHLYSQSILVRVGFAQLLMLVFLNQLFALRASGKDLLDRGAGGHKEHAKALLRDLHSHHAHENSMSMMK